MTSDYITALQPDIAHFGFVMALPIENRSSSLVTSTGLIALAGSYAIVSLSSIIASPLFDAHTCVFFGYDGGCRI